MINNINTIADKYDDMITSLQEEMSNNAAKMRSNHEESLSKFDEDIPSELGPLFKRNSVTYLKMRSEEKNLALNRKFDEAIAKKAQADRLQRIEEEQNFEKMNDYYREKKLRLMEQQSKEVKSFVQNYDGKIRTMKAQKNAELLPFQERVNRLNFKIEETLEKKGISASALNFEPTTCDRMEVLKPSDKPPVKKRSSSAVPANAAKHPRITKPKVSSFKK